MMMHCWKLSRIGRRFAGGLLLSWLLAIPAAASDPSTLSVTQLGQIKIEFEAHVPDELAAQVQLRAAKDGASLAGERDLDGLVRALLTDLAGAGYREARVRPAGFHATEGRVDFTLIIAPGPVQHVAACRFAGLARTDTAWLRETVNLPTGVPLTGKWLRDARGALSRISHLRLESPPDLVPLEVPGSDQRPVEVIWRLGETQSSEFDGLLAAGGGPSDEGLTGRASVRFDGLFGRDRSARLQYSRQQPGWHALHLEFRENGTFGGPFDWQMRLRDATQRDHRQALELGTSIRLGWQRAWRVLVEGRWQKVAPGLDPVTPSRMIEGIGGIGYAGSENRILLGNRPSVQFEIRSAYSRRTEWPLASSTAMIDHRLRLETSLHAARPLALGWQAGLGIQTRWWPLGERALGPGDEWYLGGPERMRGWEEQSLAAASGLWSSLEVARPFNHTLHLALFGEAARVRLFAPTQSTVTLFGYGIALGLRAIERTGRLEFAWPSTAPLRDGIIRLRVTQAW